MCISLLYHLGTRRNLILSHRCNSILMAHTSPLPYRMLFLFSRVLFTTASSPSSADKEIVVEYYSHLLQRCAKSSSLNSGRSLHATLYKNCILPASLFIQNHLLNMYFKCADIPSALQLFDGMPDRNVVSWSCTVAGLVQLGCSNEALLYFLRMHRVGVRPNEFSFVSCLNACALSEEITMAYQVYSQLMKMGFDSNVFLMNAFLTAMIRKGNLVDALKLFERFQDRDVVSWNSMLAGLLQLSYSEVWSFWCRMIQEGVKADEFTFSTLLTGLAQASSLNKGRQAHTQLIKCGHRDDICVGDSLVDMYLKCHAFCDGQKAFEEMPQRDVLSWTQMTSGCLQCGQSHKALELLKKMMQLGIRPNKFTLATAFSVCSSLVSLEEGRKAHGLKIKLGSDADACVDNALLDMYVKCGCLDAASIIFRSMKEHSVISWTTMIMGFAQNGLTLEALKAFDSMVFENFEPNSITFVCVLYACSQGGFIDEGWRYFSLMTRDYGILPDEGHYFCMVDLLGRAGQLAEAEALIESMPFQPAPLFWQILLGACRIHEDIDTAKRAAERALSQNRCDPSTYILLSNIFANIGRWDGVKKATFPNFWQSKYCLRRQFGKASPNTTPICVAVNALNKKAVPKRYQHLQNVDLPVVPPKNKKKPYPVPLRKMQRAAKEDKKMAEMGIEKPLEPPKNGILVPELIPIAYEVLEHWKILIKGISHLVKIVPVYGCSICPEIHVGPEGHMIQDCRGPGNVHRKSFHSWVRGSINDILIPIESYHMFDPFGLRIKHETRFKYDRIPAVVELCIQAGVEIEEYPSRRRTTPIRMLGKKVIDRGGYVKEPSKVSHSDSMSLLAELDTYGSSSLLSMADSDTKEIAERTIKAYSTVRRGLKQLMRKYSVKACGYCSEVHVGPWGHNVKLCGEFKHQWRDGKHGWQDATLDEVLPPNYVWHVRDPTSPPLTGALKRFYGKAPAVVEVCVQAGAKVPDAYSPMMRLDIVIPESEEARLVA